MKKILLNEKQYKMLLENFLTEDFITEMYIFQMG